MLETLLQAILEQIDEPKRFRKNLRALLNETVEKLDLVSKQEIERQKNSPSFSQSTFRSATKQVSLLEEALKNKNKHQRSALILYND